MEAWPGSRSSDATERALATLRAIRTPARFSRRHGLFSTRARLTRLRRYEHLWPFANAWSAVASLAEVPRAQAEAREALDPFLGAVAAYRRRPEDTSGSGAGGFESAVVPPLGPGGDRYFDDNAWLGLAMVRHYEVAGDERALTLARETFAFVASGWCDDADLVQPGGVRWRDTPDSRSRHTCSTAPAAQLALMLFRHTGDGDLLEWGSAAYGWLRRTLLDRDALYADHLAPDGAVEPTKWSYNQGATAGAGALLYVATGEQAYLDQARATAAAAHRRYDLPALVHQRPAFNAVYFRNLALLDQVLGGRTAGTPLDPLGAPEPVWATDARAYLDDRWRRARDATTGLFRDGGSPLNDTAPMIESCALLAGAPGRP